MRLEPFRAETFGLSEGVIQATYRDGYRRGSRERDDKNDDPEEREPSVDAAIDLFDELFCCDSDYRQRLGFQGVPSDSSPAFFLLMGAFVGGYITGDDVAKAIPLTPAPEGGA